MKKDEKRKVEESNKTKPKKSNITKKEIKEAKQKLKDVKNEVKVSYKPASFSLIEVIIVILITSVVVSICSGLIVFNNYDKIVSKDFTETGNLKEFIENYNHILESYVEDVDSEKLLDAAIGGMYNYLGDAYSGYLNEELSSDLQEQLDGKYSGIGVEVTSDENYITINRVFASSPAYEAGLKAGDKIIKINGVDYRGKTAADMSNAIKNSNKKTFEVTYIRDKEEKTVTLVKKEVLIESVTSKEYDNIGYIGIETFSATTAEQVKKKLDSFDSKIDSIIIDVRNNSGGYLNSAYETADLFVQKNKIIYKLKNKKGQITSYPAKNDVYKKYKSTVVLINESSASASEILAAALSESANAKLIGKKSFGKGTVQETDILSSGAMVKYTSSYWLTPNGNSINNKGLTPDVEVTNNADADKQLDEAIKILKK